MHQTDRAGEIGGAGERKLPQVALEITRGRAKHRSRQVASQAFLIGSASDCDLVLGDPRFAAVHSYLFVAPGRVTIRQLAPAPPLCVDGRQVPCAALADASRLQMGSYEFELRIQWAEDGSDVKRPSLEVEESLPIEFDCDSATGRLLADVEAYSDVPRLSLFVGDDDETDRPLPPPSEIDPRAWRQPPKKASL